MSTVPLELCGGRLTDSATGHFGAEQGVRREMPGGLWMLEGRRCRMCGMFMCGMFNAMRNPSLGWGFYSCET